MSNKLKYSSIVLLVLISFWSKQSPATAKESSLIKEAAAFEKKGNMQTALRIYRRVYSSGDERLSALGGMARTLVALKDTKDAEEFLKADIEQHPYEIENRHLLVDHYTANGQPDSALREIGFIEKLGKNDQRFTLKRARINQKKQKYAEAIVDLNIYVAGPNSDLKESLLRRAQCLSATQDFQAAEQDAKRVYGLAPMDEEVLISYLAVLLALNKFEEAEGITKQCAELHPRSIACWNFRGDIARALKKPTAVEYFVQAVELDPNHFEFRKKLADTLVENARLIEADPHYLEALRIKKDDEGSIKNYVGSLRKRQLVSESARALREFHAINPRNLWAGVEYARLTSLIGRHEEAAEIMKQTYRAEKSDLSATFYGYFLYLNGDFSGARDAIEKISDASLNKEFNIGLTYLKRKKWAKAVTSFTLIQQESPLYPSALANIALAHYADGNPEKALALLQHYSFPLTKQDGVAKQIQLFGEKPSRKTASDFNIEQAPAANLEWELPKL